MGLRKAFTPAAANSFLKELTAFQKSVKTDTGKVPSAEAFLLN